MIVALLVATLGTVELTGPDGQLIYVNPEQVVSIREPRDPERRHFAKDVHCLLNMTDGKFITVTEECVFVQKLLEQGRE